MLSPRDEPGGNHTDLDRLVDTDVRQERLLHPSQHVYEEHEDLLTNT